MYRLNILQDQWLIFALTTGTILVLAMVLAYMAFWRPREGEVGEAAPQPAARPKGFMPWFLILAFAFVLVWAVIYTIMAAMIPPNI